MKNLLITGGCGFIGSNLVNYLFEHKSKEYRVINLDKIDYCARIENVNPKVRTNPNYILVPGNVCDPDLVYNLLQIHSVDIILHLAAQSHVDHSFGNSLQFTKDNIVGTHNLLECAKKYGKLERFVYMSTDEVQGDFNLREGGKTLNPTNPYAATKASCELLVESYAKSFGLPTIIVRSNNVFGPRQYWEKLIPRFIVLLKQGKKLTIQGSGQQQRVFVYAEDVARALNIIVEKGKLFEIYSIGTTDEYSVLEIAKFLIQEINGENLGDDKVLKQKYLSFVEDRDFNDSRYYVDPSKLMELGWKQTNDFRTNLQKTVEWYSNHPELMKESSDCH